MYIKNELGPIYLGEDSNHIPIILYFNNDYINTKVQFSIDRNSWNVYFYGVNVGYVDDHGNVIIHDQELEVDA